MSPIAQHRANTDTAMNQNKDDHKIRLGISTGACREMKRQLLDYRAKLADNVPHKKLLTGLDLSSGYSRALIEHIVSSIYFIDSFETLQQKFSFLDDEHARHTWKVITDVVHYPDSEDDETGSPVFAPVKMTERTVTQILVLTVMIVIL
jgi:hypothetical protein